MFDWLFGTKRQTNYDDTNKMYNQWNDANNAANDYYKQNIENTDWDKLGRDEQAKRINEFNGLDQKRGSLGNQYGQMNKLYDQENKERKNDYFGNGLLGMLLNPAAQTATAVGDLVTGNYDTNKRDVASDIGAGVETALSLIPFGAGALGKIAGAGSKLGKLGTAAKTMSESPLGSALIGAGMGGAEAYRQGGAETNFGDALKQAGMGGAFGGAIPLVQKAGGNMLLKRGAAEYNPEGVYSGLTAGGINPLQAAMMAADPSSQTLRSVGRSNLLPKSNAGKLALGGGALFGGSKLLGAFGGGQEQPGLQQQFDTQNDTMNQLSRQVQQQLGYTPSYQELQELMKRAQQGGY